MPEKKTLNEDLFYKGSSANLPRLHMCKNKVPFWDFKEFAVTLPFQYLLHWSVGKSAIPFPGLLPFTLDLYLILSKAASRLLHFTLDLYLILSKTASSTIFWVFGMTWLGIEPLSPRPLANTQLIRPMAWTPETSRRKNENCSNLQRVLTWYLQKTNFFNEFILFVCIKITKQELATLKKSWNIKFQ